jgi:hypothetical protein
VNVLFAEAARHNLEGTEVKFTLTFDAILTGDDSVLESLTRIKSHPAVGSWSRVRVSSFRTLDVVAQVRGGMRESAAATYKDLMEILRSQHLHEAEESPELQFD